MIPVRIILGVIPKLQAGLGCLNEIGELVFGWSENDHLDFGTLRYWNRQLHSARYSYTSVEFVCLLHFHTSDSSI